MQRPYQTKTSQEIVLKDLPVGTKFYVHNGCWEGEIVMVDGKKAISHMHGIVTFTERDIEPHEVTILNDKKYGEVDYDEIPY